MSTKEVMTLNASTLDEAKRMAKSILNSANVPYIAFYVVETQTVHSLLSLTQLVDYGEEALQLLNHFVAEVSGGSDLSIELFDNQVRDLLAKAGR